VLTNAVLGVTPTGFGFERFDVVPHPGDLAWASGAVPTPTGTIRAAWRAGQGGRFELTVTSPPGTAARVGVPTGRRRVEVRVGGAVAWDGRRGIRHRATADGRAVYLHDLPPGTHEIVAVALPAAPRAGRS